MCFLRGAFTMQWTHNDADLANMDADVISHVSLYTGTLIAVFELLCVALWDFM